MPPTKQSFWDKTFNLAGLLRGFFGGLILSIVILFIFVLAKIVVTDQIIAAIFIILPIVGAYFGLKEKPKEQQAWSSWVKFWQTVFLIRLMSGKVGPADSVIPEKITVRRFFIWLVIYGLIVYIFWKAAAFQHWFEIHS